MRDLKINSYVTLWPLTHGTIEWLSHNGLQVEEYETLPAQSGHRDSKLLVQLTCLQVDKPQTKPTQEQQMHDILSVKHTLLPQKNNIYFHLLSSFWKQQILNLITQSPMQSIWWALQLMEVPLSKPEMNNSTISFLEKWNLYCCKISVTGKQEILPSNIR